MAEQGTGRDRDLVLAPGEFAFILDTTKGLVNVIVGPNKVSMSNTDQPVIWNKAARRFTRTGIDEAVQTNPIAPEGFYIALYNPADGEKNEHPRDGASSVSVPLNVGHRINIPGPVHFPLWPGQMANVIQGHHLHSNQYLLAQVYNDAEATANWTKAVVKPPEGGEAAVPAAPQSFAPGQLLIIKGTEVAFFIPPTGVKVVPENGTKTFVREAVTLERLEYCILLDEDGNKRFVQGPSVVFPEPTEKFIEKDASRKFRAIELNETTGIYVKVIADYDEAEPEIDGKRIHRKVGDELFITGATQAIYFQREEHSIIRYGEQTKHYAVAVPAGEGRYVLNRTTGVVALVVGPRMLLCDPRTEVIVRRVLSERNVRLWYPGNERVVAVNAELMADMLKGDASQYEAGRAYRSANVMHAALENTTLSSKQIAGDIFGRSTGFTPPRTITLDTKYEGAVNITVWSGYAVLVISKSGARKVVVGPKAFLLEYDETLAPLELSTGTPKTDGKLFNTVYLRVTNNKISDQVKVETRDLVRLSVSVSYRVNFEGEDHARWFEVENYVKLLCDHMRSLIRNIAKRTPVDTFYGNGIDIIRDGILGPMTTPPGPRAGRKFDENAMRVYDVEVLDIKIEDTSVGALLLDAQQDAIKAAVLLSKEERKLEVTKRIESIKQESAQAVSATVVAVHSLNAAEIASQLTVNLGRIEAEAQVETKRLTNRAEVQDALNQLNAAEIVRTNAVDMQKLEAKKADITLEIQRIHGETEEIVKRAGAVSPTLASALTTFSDQALVERIASTLAPMAMMSGVSAADVLAKLFQGTPMEGVMHQLGTRSRIPAIGNGEAGRTSSS